MYCVVSVTLAEVVKSTLQLVPVMSARYVQCLFSFVTIIVSSNPGRVVIVKNDTRLFFLFSKSFMDCVTGVSYNLKISLIK